MPLFGKKKDKPSGKGVVPVDKVKSFIEQGLPESQMIDILRNDGFSPEEIDKALTEGYKHIFFMPAEKEVDHIPIPQQPLPKPVEKPKEEVKEERPSFAPVFVKLDRYKQILSTMNYLKNSLVMIQNSLAILNDLDKLRSENLDLIRQSIEKVEKRINTLDSEFLRPSGFHEETPELHEVQSLETTIVDLKSQIEQLKSELQNTV